MQRKDLTLENAKDFLNTQLYLIDNEDLDKLALCERKDIEQALYSETNLTPDTRDTVTSYLISGHQVKVAKYVKLCCDESSIKSVILKYLNQDTTPDNIKDYIKTFASSTITKKSIDHLETQVACLILIVHFVQSKMGPEHKEEIFNFIAEKLFDHSANWANKFGGWENAFNTDIQLNEVDKDITKIRAVRNLARILETATKVALTGLAVYGIYKFATRPSGIKPSETPQIQNTRKTF